MNKNTIVPDLLESFTENKYSNLGVIAVALLGMLICWMFGVSLSFNIGLLFFGVFISILDGISVLVRHLARYFVSKRS